MAVYQTSPGHDSKQGGAIQKLEELAAGYRRGMRHCYVLRVFTADDGAGGNPLGVVPDTTGLTAEDMQQVAADLGFSETTFVSWGGREIPAVRIFTPTMELPFAGHPLVGTAFVLNVPGPGVDRMSIAIGEVSMWMDGPACWVQVPEQDPPVAEADVGEAASMGIAAQRAWRVRVPMEFFVAEVRNEDALVAADPDMAAVESVADGLYLFSSTGRLRSRFFAPQMGVPEDPATGSAAVALAAVYRYLGDQAGTLTILQGPPDYQSLLRVVWDGTVVQLGGGVALDEVRVLDV